MISDKLNFDNRKREVLQNVAARDADPPAVLIKERDLALISVVEKYRYLTTTQIKRLCFADTSVQVCRLRLLKLYQNGYLNRLRQEIAIAAGSGEIVYCLDKKGIEILATYRDEETDSAKYQPHLARVKSAFLDHTLAIISFRLAIEEAVSTRPDLRISHWFNEYDVMEPTAAKKRDRFYIYDEVIDATNNKRLAVYPDAAFVLERGTSRELYLVEIDMGTMTHKRIREKLRAYEIYRRTNRFKHRYGQEYGSFTVLFQTTSKERAKNLRESLKNEAGIDLFRIGFDNAETMRNLLYS